MSVKLKLKEFGPIRQGFGQDDGFVSFDKVTLFCGPQGSGKSTVAKLFSTLTWLEKCVYREFGFQITVDSFREALAWQGIDSYLFADSEIEFYGESIQFRYAKGDVEFFKRVDGEVAYRKPKISYMPAERNFASIVRNAIGVGNLPPPLLEMQTEFEKAKRFYASQYKLPIGNFAFEYDSKRAESWVLYVAPEQIAPSRTRLEYASSGVQSMLPLLIVPDYLVTTINADGNGEGVFHDPDTPEKKIKADAFVQRLRMSELSDKEKEARLMRFFSPGRCFVNIVEEPEQNLYPDAQYEVIKRLLTLVNLYKGNRLVISTHSPFVVNSMVMSSMASNLYSVLADRQGDETCVEYSARLGGIWQRSHSVRQEDMSLYEFDGTGGIRRLEVEGGLFSDGNKLNSFLEKWNDDFDEMLSIEEELMRGK